MTTDFLGYFQDRAEAVGNYPAVQTGITFAARRANILPREQYATVEVMRVMSFQHEVWGEWDETRVHGMLERDFVQCHHLTRAQAESAEPALVQCVDADIWRDQSVAQTIASQQRKHLAPQPDRYS